MRHTLRTIIAAGGLAALALCPASYSCDKDKTASPQPASTEPAYIVSSPCAKMRATQVAARGSCSGAKATTAASESTEWTEPALKHLVQALGSMQKCCGGECPASIEVAAALRTIVAARPDLNCETVTAALASASSCRKSGQAAPAVLAVSGSGSACCAGKAQAAAQNVAAAKSCDPAACQKAKAAAMNVAAAEAPACHGAAKARYVAFNCEKTDRVARAVARAYLDVIRELKLSTGAEGCSAQAATDVLAAVLADMEAERTATAPAEAQPVAETATVSFGAVSETKPACGSTGN